MTKGRTFKFLGTTLTVASLSISSVAGTVAFAAEAVETTAAVPAADAEQLSTVVTTYQNQNIVGEASNDPNAVVASVTVKPEFAQRATGEKLSATDSGVPQKFWDLGAEGYDRVQEDQLPYIVKFDVNTGEYTIQFKTAALNSSFKFNVGVEHTDGTSEDVSFVVNVANVNDAQKLNNKYNPAYSESASYLSDEATTIEIVAETAPSATDVQSYSVDASQASNWNVAIDAKTGKLTVAAKNPKSMPAQDETITLPVIVTYTDGSQDKLNPQFMWQNSASAAHTYTVQYNAGDKLAKGVELTVEPEFFTTEETGILSFEYIDAKMPEGTTFELVKSEVAGIKLAIDAQTGVITYTIDPSSVAEVIEVPVRVKFADGSSQEVKAEFFPIKKSLTSTDITNMEYGVSSNTIKAGETYWMRPIFFIPVLGSPYELSISGAKYSLTNVSPEMNASIEENGFISFKFNELPAQPTDYHYTVMVTLPDGTVYQQTFTYTLKDVAVASPEASSPAAEESAQPVTSSPNDELLNQESTDVLASSGVETPVSEAVALNDTSSDYSATQNHQVLASTGAYQTLGIVAGGLVLLLAGTGLVLWSGRRHLAK